MAQSTLRRCTARLGRVALRAAARASAFPGAAGGVAAVEFAMLLPVMIVMLLGMTEVTYGVNMDRKLTIMSRSLADLAARSKKITTDDMKSIFSAAAAILQPYDVSKTQMVISSVKVKKVGNDYQGEIQWSCGKNISTSSSGGNLKTRPANSSYAVPNGFQTSPSFILVETRLPYTPVFGYVITGTLPLGEITPWPVRDVDSVEFVGSCPT